MFFVGLQGQFSDVLEWNFLEPIVLGFQSNSLKHAFWTLQKKLVNLLAQDFREVGQMLEGWAELSLVQNDFLRGELLLRYKFNIYIYTPGSSKSVKMCNVTQKLPSGRSRYTQFLKICLFSCVTPLFPWFPSRLALVSKDSALGIEGLVQMNYFLLGQTAYFQMNVSFGEGTVPQPASFKWLEWPFGFFKATFSEIKRSLGRSWKTCKRIRSEPVDATVISPGWRQSYTSCFCWMKIACLLNSFSQIPRCLDLKSKIR